MADTFSRKNNLVCPFTLRPPDVYCIVSNSGLPTLHVASIVTLAHFRFDAEINILGALFAHKVFILGTVEMSSLRSCNQRMTAFIGWPKALDATGCPSRQENIGYNNRNLHLHVHRKPEMSKPLLQPVTTHPVYNSTVQVECNHRPPPPTYDRNNDLKEIFKSRFEILPKLSRKEWRSLTFSRYLAKLCYVGPVNCKVSMNRPSTTRWYGPTISAVVFGGINGSGSAKHAATYSTLQETSPVDN